MQLKEKFANRKETQLTNDIELVLSTRKQSIINAIDNNGNTLLDRICKNPKKEYLQIADILFKKGAKITILTDTNSKQPIQTKDIANLQYLKSFIKNTDILDNTITVANQLIKMIEEELPYQLSKYYLKNKLLPASYLDKNYGLTFYIEKDKKDCYGEQIVSTNKSNCLSYAQYQLQAKITPEILINILERKIECNKFTLINVRKNRRLQLKNNTYGNEFNKSFMTCSNDILLES